jgi:hypothetical protein
VTDRYGNVPTTEQADFEQKRELQRQVGMARAAARNLKAPALATEAAELLVKSSAASTSLSLVAEQLHMQADAQAERAKSYDAAAARIRMR